MLSQDRSPALGASGGMLSTLTVIADGIDHPESVIWDSDRAVLFCGGEEGQLYAVTIDGGVTQVADTGGSLLGLTLGPQGTVWACDAGRRAVVAIDPDDGSVEIISTGVSGRAFVEPNGIAFHPADAVYVTCSGTWGADDGAIYRITPDGATELWSRSATQFPNGCLIHGDELLVIESRAARIGAISLRTELWTARCQLGRVVPDQMALERTGGVVVGCYRPDVVLRVSAAGAVSHYASDPAGMLLAAPTGCTFAGPRLDLLVVANYGARQLVALPAAEPGLS
jgi:gluconolactonase